MKTTKFIIGIILISFSITNAQRDTLIYNHDKGEYEIRSWANVGGVDTFLTTFFIPSTKINPLVKCYLLKNTSNNELTYHYKISNSNNSQQSIEFFILEIDTSIFYDDASNNLWFYGKSARVNGCSWFPENLLKPGTEHDGFIIKSNNLPGIGNAYFQGQLPFYTYSEEESSAYLEEILDSLSSFPLNFVLRKAIVPVSLPGHISNMEFLDTLTSYNNQSYSLGWIKQETVKNKYEAYLTNAKVSLQQSDSLHARVYLENILREVDIDSSGAITSEAYALLRYNTEYLLSFLPEVTEPRNYLIAKASAEITTVNGVLQYSYTITNEAASNQSTANIYVEDTTTSTLSAPINWQTEKVATTLDRFYTAANPITAGTTQSGYLVTSNSLPVIGKMYVQSERFAVDTTDIKTNSYELTTVVPSERPAQINASVFIDSIISYNNRAYSLGWMQYYWVRDNNYYQLNNAKTMINMNVPASAVVILTAFEGWLDTCMSQSYFNKETYGLLKYNSIYLREKLSGQ